MAYLFGLVVVAIFFLALHYFTELTHKQKAGVTALVFLIVAGAVAFNSYKDAQRERVEEIEREYHQGKSLKCGDIEVSQKTFSYSVGTQTFIGKEGTEHYTRMISAYECQ